jgi:Nucleotidyl transferase AbiEii toxin, Type IV TA system
MNETRLHTSLRTVCQHLSDSRAAYALVGGLAVSARTEPRFTKDLDLAVAVTGDREAETLVEFLRSRRYHIEALVEQEATGRLATVRLVPPIEPALFVDLLFASSGIEPEIVAAAERVATTAHLIATKVLSRDDLRRPQDRVDLTMLVAEASEADLTAAREAMRLIHSRGFNRNKDLLVEFESLLQG